MIIGPTPAAFSKPGATAAFWRWPPACGRGCRRRLPASAPACTATWGDRAPILLQPDVWLGAGAIILPGVRVGRGAIVGANCVVTKDVPPLHVVAGQPAHTVRVLTPPPGWS